jgi:hypothetical protein
MHEKEQFFSTLTRERQIGTFLCMRLVWFWHDRERRTRTQDICPAWPPRLSVSIIFLLWPNTLRLMLFSNFQNRVLWAALVVEIKNLIYVNLLI